MLYNPEVIAEKIGVPLSEYAYAIAEASLFLSEEPTEITNESMAVSYRLALVASAFISDDSMKDAILVLDAISSHRLAN